MSEPLHLRRWRGHGAVVEIAHTRDITADDAARDRIMMAVHAYSRALSDSAPILTDDGEPLSRIDLIARIIDPVSFEKVRQGGQLDDAEWRCNRARDKAAHIETLFAARPPSSAPLLEALEEIGAERSRQINAEGWTPEHDDKHDTGELADAAACYACPPLQSFAWPWAEEWWKPKDRRANLIRAGALIVAEIERLDRATLAAAKVQQP